MGNKRDEIAERLRRRIVAGLHLGVVRHGQRLPSVRALAPEMEADPRVVLAAYRLLESEGLVEVRPKSGIYVAATAAAGGDPLPQLAQWIVGVMGQALVRGIPAITLPERMRRCLEAVSFRTVCIECNHDQIAGLCTELKRDYGLDATGVELTEIEGASHPDAVMAADLLVTTSFHAGPVQRVAESLGKPWLAIRLRPDFLAEVSRFLELGQVFFVATDRRFADKLRLIFSSTGNADNLRPLILGEEDVKQIPAGAPTYFMPSARARLEGADPPARLPPAARVFSEESARELLTFIVRANLEAVSGWQDDSPPPTPKGPRRSG